MLLAIRNRKLRIFEVGLDSSVKKTMYDSDCDRFFSPENHVEWVKIIIISSVLFSRVPVLHQQLEIWM